MRARAISVFALVACAITGIGCNAILGNDEHQVGNGAGTGNSTGGNGTGSNGTGSNGTAGTAGTSATSNGTAGTAGNSTGSSGTAGTASNSTGSSGTAGTASNSTGSNGIGSSGTTQDASADTSINPDGSSGGRDAATTGDGATPPPDDGPSETTVIIGRDVAVFDATKVEAGCTPQTTQCQGQSVFTCTAAGDWVETTPCPFTCSNGACTGACMPGAHQCNLEIPQTCDANGKWQDGTACPFACVQGNCTGSCVPSTTQACGSAAMCNAQAMQVCDTTGTWGTCPTSTKSCNALPSGWQPVALTQSTCPSGFGTPTTYYTSATGAAYTCGCNCGGTQTCSGSATLNEYGADAGAATCSGTPATRMLQFSSACVSSNWGSVYLGNAYTLSNVVYGAGPACTSMATATTQPTVTTQTTVVCSATTVCPGGACLLSAETANLCVAQAGVVATCPSGYPTRTVMAPTYDDTRNCGACTCGSTLSCNLTGVTLNNDAVACTTSHPYWMTATTNCTAGSIAPSSYPLNAAIAQATNTGTGTCAMTAPSTPGGSVALHAATTMTVCCP